MEFEASGEWFAWDRGTGEHGLDLDGLCDNAIAIFDLENSDRLNILISEDSAEGPLKFLLNEFELEEVMLVYLKLT